MRILITGASGLIGKALQKSFSEKGYELLLAGRREPKHANEIQWTVEDGFREEDLGRLEGLDAVVHLAGEGIAGLRWTEEKKKAIRESRVDGTHNLVDALVHLKQKPRVFIAGSAMGFYGDRGDEVMTETSRPGDTFLADVCREWETESRRAEDSGIRTVLLRTGIVLSKDGGALATMMTPFKFGVGGIIGSGKQWMSWISLDDVVGIINFAIENEHLRGAINVASPNPVTNEEFTKTLGDVLYRPTFLPLPEFAVNLVFGEMGDALLIHSTRVEPRRLREAGYEFKFTNLKSALENAVK
ncbi:MAG TPA: TIGR01777 family oxidoreductase [Pyrinomonadaceae bacterium]|nr:TIGR01777 family oxidoreductase [Pyrinomonadaceae bacterium]